MGKIMIICQDAENTLVYLDGNINLIGTSTVKKWAEDATGQRVNDCFYIEQEELQYYCIDGRIHLNADEERKVNEKYGKVA